AGGVTRTGGCTCDEGTEGVVDIEPGAFPSTWWHRELSTTAWRWCWTGLGTKSFFYTRSTGRFFSGGSFWGFRDIHNVIHMFSVGDSALGRSRDFRCGGMQIGVNRVGTIDISAKNVRECIGKIVMEMVLEDIWEVGRA